MNGWYFSDESKTLRYGDNRQIEIGVTHKVDCEPVICKQGLHASKRLIDALEYSPGPVLWRVNLGGVIVQGDDKMVSTERTYVGGGIDVTHELRRFARLCALDVLHLWAAPEVVVQYLKTGDESIMDAARNAARDEVLAAAWNAAWAAARSAAWDAAWAAARVAARDAAWDAAWDAARSAAWNAAWAKQNRRLTSMMAKVIFDGGGK